MFFITNLYEQISHNFYHLVFFFGIADRDKKRQSNKRVVIYFALQIQININGSIWLDAYMMACLST